MLLDWNEAGFSAGRENSIKRGPGECGKKDHVDSLYFRNLSSYLVFLQRKRGGSVQVRCEGAVENRDVSKNVSYQMKRD